MSAAARQATSPDGPDRTLLLYLIKYAQLKSSMHLGAALEAYGVTAVQFRILAEINHHKDISSAELSRLFDVRPQTMNKQIAHLEAAGLIARGESPSNRRVLEMTLTAAGRRALRNCFEEARRVEKTLFRRFSKEQRETFRALLTQLLDSMD